MYDSYKDSNEFKTVKEMFEDVSRKKKELISSKSKN